MRSSYLYFVCPYLHYNCSITLYLPTCVTSAYLYDVCLALLCVATCCYDVWLPKRCTCLLASCLWEVDVLVCSHPYCLFSNYARDMLTACFLIRPATILEAFYTSLPAAILASYFCRSVGRHSFCLFVLMFCLPPSPFLRAYC